MLRLQRAHYSASIADFLRVEARAILGDMAHHHPHDLDPRTKNTWLDQIALLQRELSQVNEGWVAFEFAIPRMGKRADAVVILGGIIFVLEFKVGSADFVPHDIEQVTDYALDLKNFHEGSYSRIIVPVLIATQAPPKPSQLDFFPNTNDRVAVPILSNGNGLGGMLMRELRQLSREPSLDPQQWLASGYKPTPTIIEAAQALYKQHRVEEITRSGADEKNLGITTERLTQIINQARDLRQKAICFVTGVPGAGKTLAGLNLVVGRQHDRGDATFLSGNGPLVEVLREALARDRAYPSSLSRPRPSLSGARREVRSFIQPIHHFREEYLRIEGPPPDHVVVFDEAQRAWNQSKIERFMRERHGIQAFGKSEPEFLIEVMDRHREWCVVICLVGGGQEINDGEAGLLEWFDALERRFPGWVVHTSDQLEVPVYNWGYNLASRIVSLRHTVEPNLHLAVSIRSFRAESLANFVDAVVANTPERAASIFDQIHAAYPILLTRDLSKARNWLRNIARGSERFGLVACSGASRLKPEGLNVHEKVDAPNWFLNPRSDVRSSFYLEDPATEFDIQGLELDWVGVCWEADFRRVECHWSHHKFQGTKWQAIRSDAAQRYLANAYRVLLTRARQGMVIYVPRGDAADPTRPPELYDGIADYLAQCGIPRLA